MLRIDKNKLVILFLLTSLIFALVFVGMNMLVGTADPEEIYLHSETPLVPVHMYLHLHQQFKPRTDG